MPPMFHVKHETSPRANPLIGFGRSFESIMGEPIPIGGVGPDQVLEDPMVATAQVSIGIVGQRVR